ncbi:golgin subfamily B member 1 isoform X1 [Hydra vulgaris]|uniref:golgin subfamily B member 1 isoform X1 n=1 Tax=Hydra vulgaris TaxID=6087 RepID=UPI0032E9FD0E
MALTTEGPLSKLVDLALHGPDVEVVNFKYLRILLVEILKIVHVNSKSSLDIIEISGITDDQNCKVESENNSDKTNFNGFKEYFVDDIKRLLENQKLLENRINKLEKGSSMFDFFPSNNEIFNIEESIMLNKKNLTNDNNFLSSQNSNLSQNVNQNLNNNDGALCLTWNTIKTSRRLQVVEEGVDKLFSLMKEVLEQTRKEGSLNDLHTQINQINENTEFKIKHLETQIAEMHENDNWTKKLNKINDGTELKIKQLETIVAELQDDDKLTKKLNSINDKFTIEVLKIQEEIKSDHKSRFGNLDNTEIKDIIEKMHSVHKSSGNFNDVFSTCNDVKNPIHDSNGDLEVIKNEINEIKSALKQNGVIVSQQQPSKNQDLLAKSEKYSDLFKNDFEIKDKENEDEDEEMFLKNKSTTHYDHENFVSIQNQTQKNASDILFLQKSLTVLQNILSSNSTNEQSEDILNNLSDASKKILCNTSDSSEKLESITSKNIIDNPNQMYKDLSNQLFLLQEEQKKLLRNTESFSKEVREELSHEQKEIDVLHKQIEKLNTKIFSKKSLNDGDINNYDKVKNDNDDIRSEIPEKTVLNEKMDLRIFEERYQLIDDCLQDALQRIDTYVKHGTSLEDALNKLTEDINSKIDSNTEGKLKKFLEERLKDIQKKCYSLLEDARLDKTNAAGLRKPLGSYSCISCNRTVDVLTSGFMPTVPQKFPSKKTMAPYTSYELDQLRQQKFGTNPTLSDRPCGGQHTAINNLLYRSQKGLPVDDVLQKDLAFEAKEFSFGDCVVGTDGHIYRGKYQQYPKKSAIHNSRKQGSPPQHVSHSAISSHSKHSMDSKTDEKSHLFVSSRPHSADFTKQTSPVLPPIIQSHKSAEDCRAEVF